MKSKKIVPVLTLTLALSLFLAGLAAAQKPAPPPPPPPANPAEIEAWQSLRLEHLEKIGPLRDQLWAKKMEYEALTRNSEVKMPEVRAVIEEMVKIKAQIRGERAKLFSLMKEKGLSGPAWGPPGGGCCEEGGPWERPGRGPGGKDRRPGPGWDQRL